MSSDQPPSIIIKRVKKVAAGHHGGSWKVAYADFVTAMMAFFLLMWLMGSTTAAEREAIAAYFQNPSAIQGAGGQGSTLIKLGGVHDRAKSSGEESDEGFDGEDEEAGTDADLDNKLDGTSEEKNFEGMLEALREAIQVSLILQDFKDQLKLDITHEGLRIQIIDAKNRSLFLSGKPELKSYAKELLAELSKVIAAVPNRISVSGHTDASSFSKGKWYSNWELSADRANSTRRTLLANGVREDQIIRVVGLAAVDLFDTENPLSPVNRRISIVILNEGAENSILGSNR